MGANIDIRIDEVRTGKAVPFSRPGSRSATSGTNISITRSCCPCRVKTELRDHCIRAGASVPVAASHWRCICRWVAPWRVTRRGCSSLRLMRGSS